MEIMRYLIVFLLLTASVLSVQGSQKDVHQPVLASAKAKTVILEKRKKERKIDLKDPKTLSILAFVASLSGALIIALPYLSLLGLILGLGGLILGWMMRKRTEKKLWARLAIVLGGLCLLFFLAILGLVIFF